MLKEVQVCIKMWDVVGGSETVFC